MRAQIQGGVVEPGPTIFIVVVHGTDYCVYLNGENKIIDNNIPSHNIRVSLIQSYLFGNPLILFHHLLHQFFWHTQPLQQTFQRLIDFFLFALLLCQHLLFLQFFGLFFEEGFVLFDVELFKFLHFVRISVVVGLGISPPVNFFLCFWLHLI